MGRYRRKYSLSLVQQKAFDSMERSQRARWRHSAVKAEYERHVRTMYGGYGDVWVSSLRPDLLMTRIQSDVVSPKATNLKKLSVLRRDRRSTVCLYVPHRCQDRSFNSVMRGRENRCRDTP